MQHWDPIIPRCKFCHCLCLSKCYWRPKKELCQCCGMVKILTARHQNSCWKTILLFILIKNGRFDMGLWLFISDMSRLFFCIMPFHVFMVNWIHLCNGIWLDLSGHRYTYPVPDMEACQIFVNCSPWWIEGGFVSLSMVANEACALLLFLVMTSEKDSLAFLANYNM